MQRALIRPFGKKKAKITTVMLCFFARFGDRALAEVVSFSCGSCPEHWLHCGKLPARRALALRVALILAPTLNRQTLKPKIYGSAAAIGFLESASWREAWVASQPSRQLLGERFQSSNHMGCLKRPHSVDGKPKMQLSGFMESVV